MLVIHIQCTTNSEILQIDLTTAYQGANVTDMNKTVQNLIDNQAEAVNSKAYCILLDLGYDPSEAYDAIYNTEFDLIEEVEDEIYDALVD